jgi:hypothetical protein
MTTLTNALLVAAIAVALLGPLAFRAMAGRFDPFEPYTLFVVAYGVMFVVRPAAMLASGSLVYLGPSNDLDISETFTEMLVVALVGAVAFVVGYSSDAGRKLAERWPRGLREATDTRRLLFLAGLLAGLGLAAFLAVVASLDGLQTLEAIFRSGKSADIGEAVETYRYGWMSYLFLIPAAMVFLAVALQTRSKALFVAFALLALLVLLRGIPLGNRMMLLPLLGGIFVLVYVHRSARPSLVTVTAVAVLALFASAFLSDLRGRADRHETVAETVVRAASPSRVADSVVKGPDTEMAATLAAALTVIPERLSHTYGTTIFEDLVVRPIPRPLWSGKPQVPRNELKAVLWPREYANGTLNPEFSALLYFYWDFGLLGVVVGLAAYGVAARWLYEYFLRHREQLYAQVFYALAVWFVAIALRDSPVDTLMRAAFILAPLWVLFWLARSTARSQGAETVSPRPRAAA